MQGSEKKLRDRGVKGVAYAQQVGIGSFTIFKGKNFRSTSFCISGSSKVDLQDAGYPGLSRVIK